MKVNQMPPIGKGNASGWAEWDGLINTCTAIDAARNKEQTK